LRDAGLPVSEEPKHAVQDFIAESLRRRAVGGDRPSHALSGSLTDRELDVRTLTAQALSNRAVTG
jgi:ATP/maltotriose-dependent transcriptional regulator MalT